MSSISAEYVAHGRSIVALLLSVADLGVHLWQSHNSYVTLMGLGLYRVILLLSRCALVSFVDIPPVNTNRNLNEIRPLLPTVQRLIKSRIKKKSERSLPDHLHHCIHSVW